MRRAAVAIVLVGSLAAAVTATAVLTRMRAHEPAAAMGPAPGTSDVDATAVDRSDRPRRVPGAGDEPAAEETVHVEGSVSNGDAAPVAGALVDLVVLDRPAELVEAVTRFESIQDQFRRSAVLTVPTEVVARTTSAVDGSFSVSAAGRRPLAVRVSADGYATECMPPDESGALPGVELSRPEPFALHVVDRHEHPVEGATVLVYSYADQNAPYRRQATDAEGRVTVSAAQHHEVIVRAPGYAPEWSDLASIVGGRIVLRRGATISGVVVDTSGDPIEDALVVYWEDGVAPARTAADGTFTLAGLWATTDTPNELLVLARGFLPADWSARGGATGVRIVCDPGAELSGEVRGPDGEELAGAHVFALGEHGSDETVTDDAGRFLLTRCPTGRITLGATLEVLVGDAGETVHGGGAETELDVAAGERRDGLRLDVEALDVSYVVARFETPDGLPVSHARIEGAEHLRWGRSVPSGTRDDGTVVWRPAAAPAGDVVRLSVIVPDGLARGLHRVSATTRTSFRDPPETIVLQPGRVRDTARLRVRLVPQGTPWATPLADARVEIRGRPMDRTDDDELIFEKRLVPTIPSTWEASHVVATAEGRARVYVSLPEVRGETLELDIPLPPAATVVGRLVTRAGVPVGGRRVKVKLDVNASTTSASFVDRDAVGADGRFEVADLACGRGRLTVEDDMNDVIVAEQTIEVPIGATLDVGDVVVGSAPVLEGRILVGGRPTGGVGITAEDADGTYARTSSFADGGFEIVAPPRPGAVLVVMSEDWAFDGVRYHLAELAATGAPVIEARPGPATTFHAPPAVRAKALVFRLPGGPRIVPSIRPGGAPGARTIEGLPAGRLTVEFPGADGKPERRTIDVSATPGSSGAR